MTVCRRIALPRTLACLPVALAACSAGIDQRLPAVPAQPPAWAADHHMHLGSADLCARVGDCLETRQPPAVLAADVVAALDDAGVGRGVAFSSAYLYGLPDLGLDAADVARWMRRENEFTAAEVARHPERLTGFLSVDPLSPAAREEIAYWRNSRELVGLKLHLTASGVDLADPEHRERLGRVLATAAGQGLPVVMHIGGNGFDAGAAATFIEDILPQAGASPVQIAHAAGGYPVVAGRQASILREFAAHIDSGDMRTANLYFDLSHVPAPEDTAESAAAIVQAMRRIGLQRFLFGSDFNVRTPAEQVRELARLGLSDAELHMLATNCAPWACGAGESISPSSSGEPVGDAAERASGLDRATAP